MNPPIAINGTLAIALDCPKNEVAIVARNVEHLSPEDGKAIAVPNFRA
jgi:hypothetical protein